MARFYSIPGLTPSGGEGRMGSSGVDGPSRTESLRQEPRYREFYAERDRRRREEPDSFASGFTDGDREMFRGQEVTVEHVEKLRPGVERLYLRGDKTGSYISNWEKTGDGSAILTDAKGSKE